MTIMISHFEGACFERLIQSTNNYRGGQYPNPVVGAMVILNDQVISEGYHLKAGTDHAEVIALNLAGDLANGATLLITLEPCVHFGKTPPCVERIIESNVARVIWAVNDPNPEVSGKAYRFLTERNIECVDNVFFDEGQALIKEFYTFHQKKRPYFYLKLAVSQDGMLAPDRQKLTYLSSTASLNEVQRLRRLNQAIIVGVDTINIDVPNLGVNDTNLDQPMIAVIDPKGTVSLDWLHDALDKGRRLVLFTKGVDVAIRHDQLMVCTDLTDDKIKNWRIISDYLYGCDCQSVLVEGGSRVALSLMEANYFDECWLFRVPKLIAGPDCVPLLLPGDDDQYFDQFTVASVRDFDGDECSIYLNHHAV